MFKCLVWPCPATFILLLFETPSILTHCLLKSEFSLNQSGICRYIRTSLMSRNSRFNQWECVFWLECCVSQQTKRFKMADKESREYFPMPWMRAFRRYIFISNWVKYCPNYKIKGKFVFAFHVTDNSAQITIILGPKEAPQNAMRATFDELLLSFFGKRPYNR